jgi:hypothetical protein
MRAFLLFVFLAINNILQIVELHGYVVYKKLTKRQIACFFAFNIMVIS